MENRDLKAEFFRALGKHAKKGAIVASNSSSMGPGMLSAYFAETGGSDADFVNLHFFSPAEHPMMQLVEIIRGKRTSDDAVATAHAFVRKIGKTPLVLNDGSRGLSRQRRSRRVLPGSRGALPRGNAHRDDRRRDSQGRAADGPLRARRSGRSRHRRRHVRHDRGGTRAHNRAPGLEDAQARSLGIKSGAGYYEYEGGQKKGEWSGLAALVPDRGSRVASEDEIVERCMRALYSKARELLDRGIVASDAEADLAFVFGIGFAMHLGGPLYYGRLRGWDRG